MTTPTTMTTSMITIATTMTTDVVVAPSLVGILVGFMLLLTGTVPVGIIAESVSVGVTVWRGVANVVSSGVERKYTQHDK